MKRDKNHKDKTGEDLYRAYEIRKITEGERSIKEHGDVSHAQAGRRLRKWLTIESNTQSVQLEIISGCGNKMGEEEIAYVMERLKDISNGNGRNRSWSKIKAGFKK